MKFKRNEAGDSNTWHGTKLNYWHCLWHDPSLFCIEWSQLNCESFLLSCQVHLSRHSHIGHIFPNDVILPPHSLCPKEHNPLFYGLCVKCLKYELNENGASVYLSCNTIACFLSTGLLRKVETKLLKCVYITNYLHFFAMFFKFLTP
jgi:hypothetical protein